MKEIKKLLIVDDDNNVIKLLSSYLLSHGFLVNSVNNVESALVLIHRNKPDLIITDIMMKKLDGYDFIKLLKLDDLFLDIPIIFLTAKGMTSDRIRGYNLGCHAYITKPFNPQELLSIINSIFKNINIFKLKYINRCAISNINHDKIYSFTNREKNILQLVMKGYMNKEIAMQLNLSLRNIEKYVSRLLSKTNTRNRTELVKLIMSSSIIDI